MNLSKRTKDILEWLACIIIAFILALLIRFFIGTPTVVQQPSMKPTLQPNERLLLNRLTRTFKEMPSRGDIITFEAPSKKYIDSSEVNMENPVAVYDRKIDSLLSKFLYYVMEVSKESYIKRVIGLPGDHVKIENGKVYINDVELDEPYLREGVLTGQLKGADTPYLDVVVPKGHLFLMGDNRPNSTDSRCFGCVPYDKIESRVVIRFWPLAKFGTVE